MTACLRIGLGAEHYALRVEHVREVAELGEIVALPGAGRHVQGLRSLRGEILPVLRLDRLLGVDAPVVKQLVIVEDGNRRAGLAITVAAAIETLADGDRPDGGGTFTARSVLHDGRLIGVVDVPLVLDAVAEGLR